MFVESWLSLLTLVRSILTIMYKSMSNVCEWIYNIIGFQLYKTCFMLWCKISFKGKTFNLL